MNDTTPKYPFKFLDAYTNEDVPIFFGREEESNALYQMAFQSNIVLVYGASGTGKTSLIQCGLASKFQSHDWLALPIRRNNNINESFEKALEQAAGQHLKSQTSLDLDWLDHIMDEEEVPSKPKSKWEKLLEAVYLNHFKPIYIIFDQFEELYILGNREEQQLFIQQMVEILQLTQPITLIFSIREEYLGHLFEFEKAVPQLLRKKLRVEPMNLSKVKEVVFGAAQYQNSNVSLAQGEEEGIAEGIFQKLKGKGTKLTIDLPYLQVLLDKLYLSVTQDETRQAHAELKQSDVENLKDIEDLLRDFLAEQVRGIQQKTQHPEEVLWKLLSPFATLEGTKEPIAKTEIYQRLAKNLNDEHTLTSQQIDELLAAFVNNRILRYSEEEGLYELAHDSLAIHISEKRSKDDIALLEIQRLIKGQTSLKKEARNPFNANQLAFMEPYLAKLSLDEDEQQFIDFSKTQIALQKAEKDRIRQREIEDAQRIKTNFRIALGTAIAALALAIVAGYFYLSAEKKAKAEFEARQQILVKDSLNSIAKYNQYVAEANGLATQQLYDQAVNKLQFAKEFTKDTLAINAQIDSLKRLEQRTQNLTQLLTEANALVQKGNYQAAIKKYRFAYLLNDPSTILKLRIPLKDLQQILSKKISTANANAQAVSFDAKRKNRYLNEAKQAKNLLNQVNDLLKKQ
ncbi:MAG: ATP-binding protein [Flammeovirgaceae bacterium]